MNSGLYNSCNHLLLLNFLWPVWERSCRSKNEQIESKTSSYPSLVTTWWGQGKAHASKSDLARSSLLLLLVLLLHVLVHQLLGGRHTAPCWSRVDLSNHYWISKHFKQVRESLETCHHAARTAGRSSSPSCCSPQGRRCLRPPWSPSQRRQTV